VTAPLIAEPEISMTAAHAPGDHHYSPGGTRQLMRVLQPAASSVLMDACLAATGDLLNVAKALLSGWRHNLCVIAGQTASFRRILPLRMPLKGNAHGF
jgi:hypothetical protein